MFNAKVSLEWSEEVKGSKRRGKLRMLKISSGIKKENLEGDRKFYFYENPKEGKKKL